MEISASLVKDLREKTGAGMMDCKKALTESQGDFEKAVDYLRKKGLAAAAKKAGRAATDGSVVCISSSDGKTAVMLEVNCETDFVARNEGFQSFVADIANHILAKKPSDMNALLSQPFSKDTSKTISALHTEAVSKIGENIVIRRFEIMNLKSSGMIGTYIHGGGKIGVLVELNSPQTNDTVSQLAKDLAMQVAAANPSFVQRNEVPANVIEKEKEIFLAQLKQDPKNANKPTNVLEKIIEGKVQKYFNDICLVNQVFVKDPSKTITQLLTEASSKAGGNVSVQRFVRFQLGEGLSKDTETVGNA